VAKDDRGSSVYDYYASRAELSKESISSLATCWARRVDDDRSLSRDPRRNGATKYQDKIGEQEKLGLPLLVEELRLNRPLRPTIEGWFSLGVDFELERPWFSRDDNLLHALDNPVRKDRLFGAPFMAASSWKGLLRWACLQGHTAEEMKAGRGKRVSERSPGWVIHLFGNDRTEEEEFVRGALAFRPTWFRPGSDESGTRVLDFELINPHRRTSSRERKGRGHQNDRNSGGRGRRDRPRTNPITFEVVPVGARGSLELLYAPFQRLPERDEKTTFQSLFSAIEKLLTTYGFSARRSSGWGRAKIRSWWIAGVGGERKLNSLSDCLAELHMVRYHGGEG